MKILQYTWGSTTNGVRMGLPQYAIDILARVFSYNELLIINDKWDTFARINANNLSEQQMVDTAKMVLSCAIGG